ncbi:MULTISPECIES: flagellar basal body-associated FliL family protein [Citrobacter]|jgi:flagellar FliL protein|uniref:Flagellar protein FliL n=2 Tax=Citrobacter freundii complex TaxID=1344959 RepID=A0AAE7KXM9_CITFR|nr:MULTISPECIES: flagellar basal body-associated FliL family protein [Citrobacter]MBA7728791.1 flagellar basal body-associated FliL family protein [Citrobacter freundii]NTZ49499.1 flagellar basal body-associated FliL family protein [Citrobacter gillenii]QCA19709.1 flagellar basal body-associated FliL family protein [Citrobacter freundii]QLO12833.1 flagellar basal body-associated FliL family protein [Citrobacter freundii]QLS07354.1 flagellar basal body-associated FliL family protein [Citrobacte
MKKIVIASVISSVLALVVGGGAGWGMYHFVGNGKPAAAAHTDAVESMDESNSLFVSLQETIVTLHDNEGADHYMSAELVLVVATEKESEKIKQQEPLYQSIAVERLSEMKYEEVRAMKISQIRALIAEALKEELKNRKITAPYKDILVKKVVFQ